MTTKWQQRVSGMVAGGVLLAVPVLTLLALSAGVFGGSAGGEAPVSAIGTTDSGADGLLRIDRATVTSKDASQTDGEGETLLRNWNYTDAGNDASADAPGHGGVPPGQAKKNASPASQSAAPFAPGRAG